jgi:uncharacterized DUF497 family protein
MHYFEWDSRKAFLNELKHGVPFEEGATVFFDEQLMLAPDPSHSKSEDRLIALGKSDAKRILFVCSLIGGQRIMKKKSTALSAHELLTRRKGKSTPPKIKDADIDYSDIPKFSTAALKKFKRVGRPLMGDSPRQAISVRIETDVLSKIKARAKKAGIGYQSLINELLKKSV